ncbi:hypothetical protein Ancab_006484 [Ancistrocladus abbreviatus]
MVHQAELVIICTSVGVAVGIVIASLIFLFVKRYKKHSAQPRCLNDNSPSSIPIHQNGLGIGIGPSTSSSNSIVVQLPEHVAKNLQPSWWTHHNKERSPSVSGIPRYSYKDIQKATQNFTTILGQGSFGPVYKATLPADEVVAVKVLAADSRQGGERVPDRGVITWSITSPESSEFGRLLCGKRPTHASLSIYE